MAVPEQAVALMVFQIIGDGQGQGLAVGGISDIPKNVLSSGGIKVSQGIQRQNMICPDCDIHIGPRCSDSVRQAIQKMLPAVQHQRIR